MKDEIKEILDIIKKVSKAEENSYYALIKTPPMKWKIFLDYITNLQEKYKKSCETYQRALDETMSEKMDLEKENEKLKEIEKEHKNCTRKHWQQKCAEHCANEMLYKSRNEKAIEKLKSIRIFGLRTGKTLFSTLINETIDILDGSNEQSICHLSKTML